MSDRMGVNCLRSLVGVPEYENNPQFDLPVISVKCEFKLWATGPWALLLCWRLKAQLTEEESGVCEGDGHTVIPSPCSFNVVILCWSHTVFSLNLLFSSVSECFLSLFTQSECDLCGVCVKSFFKRCLYALNLQKLPTTSPCGHAPYPPLMFLFWLLFKAALCVLYHHVSWIHMFILCQFWRPSVDRVVFLFGGCDVCFVV